jgi:hypothetical protein
MKCNFTFCCRQGCSLVRNTTSINGHGWAVRGTECLSLQYGSQNWISITKITQAFYSLNGVRLRSCGIVAAKGPTVHPPEDIWMTMEERWYDTDKGKSKDRLEEKPLNLSECHFVHHKFHMDCTGSEPLLRAIFALPLYWAMRFDMNRLLWLHVGIYSWNTQNDRNAFECWHFQNVRCNYYTVMIRPPEFEKWATRFGNFCCTLCAGIDTSINSLRTDKSHSLGEAENVSPRHYIQTISGADPNAPGGSFPKCKEDMVEGKLADPSSGEVSSTWRFFSTPPTHLRGVLLLRKGNFTFLCTLYIILHRILKWLCKILTLFHTTSSCKLKLT